MNKLNTLAISVALLFGSQSALALKPWVDGNPDITIHISGAVAQTNAYNQVVNTVLAAAGTVDSFSDVDPVTSSVGSRWVGHYFTGNANLGSGLAGKKILLLRRNVGGSGYGVVPIIYNIPLEHLRVLGLPKTSWTSDATGTNWTRTISSANASASLTNSISDGGVIAVDPYILLKPGTRDYPTQQNTLITGQPEPGWPTNLSQVPTTGTNAITVNTSGGLVYGVAVTLDLYKVLQAAQKRAGLLPSTVIVGHYSESDMPNLSRNVIGSLLAGSIGAWNQIKIVDQTDGNVVKSLVDSSILADAGVAAPYKEATTGKNLTPVAVALRNNGAATSVIAYSVFLDYPSAQNAFVPANPTADDAVIEDASLPIVKAPVIVSDTGTLLKDWQNGTNVLGFNNVTEGSAYANRWGIAINSADKNTSVTASGTGGDPWRYIKIDGYAPTLANVAAGTYTYWAEGSVLYRTSRTTDAQWALKTTVMKTLADNMSSPTVVGAVTTTQAWGKTGTFATTADPRGFQESIPFNSSNPVVPFSHTRNGVLHTEIVPVANPKTAGGLVVQMK